ncbi:MAG: asparagine synthetase B [Candidatus Riflebacteria bacterium]|nr:asparagine synthetase B [Candidatus Riflebacteria bacterium]
MSGIFGIIHRDGSPVSDEQVIVFQKAMCHWKSDRVNIWKSGCAVFGQDLLLSTPEAQLEKPLAFDKETGLVFTTECRVDNRKELARSLNIPLAQANQLPDSEFIRRSFLKWGEECPVRIHGDWSFAIWKPGERRLFLARDHCGVTALHYYADRKIFVFASDKIALLALGIFPPDINEFHLAQILISWSPSEGGGDIFTHIRHLPPAHKLSLTPERIETSRYYRLEDTPQLCLKDRREYVDGFLDVWDTAVKARLRALGPPSAQLSGGLDSGSIVATAAPLLKQDGLILHTFTSIPLYPTPNDNFNRFLNELPFAQRTAEFVGNIHMHEVNSEALNPIQAIRKALAINPEPLHAAGNFFWLLEMNRQVAELGAKVLLIGQTGNASISWKGFMRSQPFAVQARHLGLIGMFKEQFRFVKLMACEILPPCTITALRKKRKSSQTRHLASSIHPDFANHLNLWDLQMADPRINFQISPFRNRIEVLLPGRSGPGRLHAIIAAAAGIEIRDPTSDARVQAYTLSIPDKIFIDPKTGVGRWLIREAMKGRLPDEIRLNKTRGLQAGDLVGRLRHCAEEVEEALSELKGGRAAEYINVPYLYAIWQKILVEDTRETFRQAVTTLTRGIMAGLFVNWTEAQRRQTSREN